MRPGRSRALPWTAFPSAPDPIGGAETELPSPARWYKRGEEPDAMSQPPIHLTYCTNIHPGETWPEVRENIERYVLAVRDRVAGGRPFGVGLRLSAEAARALALPEELRAFKSFLAENNLYVFTINGFPYGAFHGTRVKERVYLPDWREDERVRYTTELAEILAEILPPGSAMEGSVSTVPGCFKARASESAGGADGSNRAESEMAERIVRHAAALHGIKERTGRTIALALEPEPCCFLETTAEAVDFFQQRLFSRAARDLLHAIAGVPLAACEEVLRRHIGVCLDACHAAVEFEEPGEAIRALRAAGIRIPKIQLSAGLRVPRADPESLRALEPFAEGVYLHQVVARRGDALTRYTDLPEAIASATSRDASEEEWRVHFHVPLFREALGPFENTQPFLRELLGIQARDPLTCHLEVETYTWDVLPEEHRGEDVVSAVARELQWVIDRLPTAASEPK